LVGDQLFLLLFGLVILYFQIYFVSSFRTLLALFSLESFSWLSLLLSSSVSSGVYLFALYFLLMLFVLGDLRESVYLGLPLILGLLNFPLSLNFFIKFQTLVSLGLFSRVCLLLVLVLIFCSILSALFLLFSLIILGKLGVTSYGDLFIFLFLLGFLLVLF